MPPAYCHPVAYEAFDRRLESIHQPEGLFQAASAIALHADCEERIETALHAVHRLAETVRSRTKSSDDRARLAHLHDVLFDVAGFRGATDNYYAPSNSYLPQAIRSRVGIPITLSLIYRTVASLIGLKAEGVNAPGHFLVQVHLHEGGSKRTLYVDPYYGGVLLTTDEAYRRISQATGQTIAPDPRLLAVATPAEWLFRMLRNLQAVFARSGDERSLLAMQELESLLNNATQRSYPE